MTFKEWCKELNIKVPLTKKMYDYYRLLGINCLMYHTMFNSVIIVSSHYTFNFIKCLTISDLRILLSYEDFNISNRWQAIRKNHDNK